MRLMRNEMHSLLAYLTETLVQRVKMRVNDAIRMRENALNTVHANVGKVDIAGHLPKVDFCLAKESKLGGSPLDSVAPRTSSNSWSARTAYSDATIVHCLKVTL